MRKVLLYSLLLICGLVASQFLAAAPPALRAAVSPATMFCLAFIMIHVGYEFDVDKSRAAQYAKDFAIAASAAVLPWLFCAVYLVVAMNPPALRSHPDAWRDALLQGLFAAPTSAGVLFSMLAAAGLGATWVFAKARTLAIFDDLSTILLLIPLQAMMIGLRWQLLVTALVIVVLLWLAWSHLNALRLPIAWPFTMAYAAAIVIVCQAVYHGSKHIDPDLPLHLEVLLPAFALGCVIRTSHLHDPHAQHDAEGTLPGPENPAELRVSTIISACFMVLVGASMPPIFSGSGGAAAPISHRFADVAPDVLAARNATPPWCTIALHVAAILVLSNLGKMLPALCYRREAPWRSRLALAVGMFPRGEVGAGALIIALGYGAAGPALTVAVLSLALNLVATGAFILAVKRLLRA